MNTYDDGAGTHGSARFWTSLRRLLRRWFDRERELVALRNAVGMMSEARRADAREYHDMVDALRRQRAQIETLERQAGALQARLSHIEGDAGADVPVELDAAGHPKLPLTLLEQKAIATLNTVKAWRDSDGNEPFPDDAREGMELVLMLAAARRKGVR
jgi:hypothetical protein